MLTAHFILQNFFAISLSKEFVKRRRWKGAFKGKKDKKRGELYDYMNYKTIKDLSFKAIENPELNLNIESIFKWFLRINFISIEVLINIKHYQKGAKI